jgi:hypothetical protein
MTAYNLAEMLIPHPNFTFLAWVLRNYLLFFLFLVMVAAWFFIKRLPGWVRSSWASSWPIAEGRVETVGVNAFAQQAVAEIGYSYFVEGIRYSGYFSKQFAHEQDAWNYVSPLKGENVVVRYKSSSPNVSAIRLGEQRVLFKNQSGGFSRRLVDVFLENI